MNVGEKIKLYRKRLNISGKELAQKLDVTPALITYYEQGKRQVPLKTLMQISEIIKVPLEYFVTDKEYISYSAYRGKGRITKEEKEEVALFEEIVDNYIRIAKLNDFDIHYQGPNEYRGKTISDQEIGIIKAQLEVPLIVHYNNLVEALWLKWRIAVFALPFRNTNLSAITIRRDDIYCVFINKGHTIERNFFSLAHELGHILMHLDTDEFIISRLGSRDPKEKEANEFASRFTVPYALLMNKVGNNSFSETITADKIWELAKYFNVSYECIVYNLVKANILNYGKDEIARLKEPIKEYEYNITIDDFPAIYRLLVYLTWRKGEISISKAGNYLLSDIQTVNDEFGKIGKILGRV
ncbi:MAG: XRE family transcriptional regulator [Candidatus Cloacimonas sp.]